MTSSRYSGPEKGLMTTGERTVHLAEILLHKMFKEVLIFEMFLNKLPLPSQNVIPRQDAAAVAL